MKGTQIKIRDKKRDKQALQHKQEMAQRSNQFSKNKPPKNKIK